MTSIIDDKAAAGRQQQQPRDDDSSNNLQLPDIHVAEADVAPPPYGEDHDQVHFSQPGFDAGAKVTGKSTTPPDSFAQIHLHTSLGA
jgi:hypothetical protein